MQGAMRSMSSNTFQASLGGRGTSKVLLISMLGRSVDVGAEPFGDYMSQREQRLVFVVTGDELDTDRQAVRPAMGGKRDRGYVQGGPEFLEHRFAGGVESFRRFAGDA